VTCAWGLARVFAAAAEVARTTSNKRVDITLFASLLKVKNLSWHQVALLLSLGALGPFVSGIVFLACLLPRRERQQTRAPAKLQPAPATSSASTMGLCVSKEAPAATDTAATKYRHEGDDYALFFPDPAMPCNRYLAGQECRRYASGACEYAHKETSLVRLLRLLNGARSTLDVCVFTITANEIRDALLDAHRRGVRVRIISDDEQMWSQGSDVRDLMRAGIPTKTDSSECHMHHKVAIIDGAKVLTGSFNWTRQAVIGNQENICVMHSPAIVAQYQVTRACSQDQVRVAAAPPASQTRLP